MTHPVIALPIDRNCFAPDPKSCAIPKEWKEARSDVPVFNPGMPKNLTKRRYVYQCFALVLSQELTPLSFSDNILTWGQNKIKRRFVLV